MHQRLNSASPTARDEDLSDTESCTPLLDISMADLASVYPQVGDAYFMGNIHEHAPESSNEGFANKDSDRCRLHRMVTRKKADISVITAASMHARFSNLALRADKILNIATAITSIQENKRAVEQNQLSRSSPTWRLSLYP